MQKLFDFYPSEIKSVSQFFKSSDCDIIRNYDGRGYFVVTKERHKTQPRFSSQDFYRMWWVIHIPENYKRLRGRIECYQRAIPLT